MGNVLFCHTSHELLPFLSSEGEEKETAEDEGWSARRILREITCGCFCGKEFDDLSLSDCSSDKNKDSLIFDDTKEIFTFYDSNGDGVISPIDFSKSLQRLSLPGNDEQLRGYFRNYITNEGVQNVNYSMFVDLFRSDVYDHPMLWHMDRLELLYSVIDQDRDGYLSVSDIYTTLSNSGMNVTTTDVKKILGDLNSETKLKIDFNDFILLTSTNV